MYILCNLEQVLQLADEVESLFVKHFASNDRTVAMKYLKPQQARSTHMITFLVGTWIQIPDFIYLPSSIYD